MPAPVKILFVCLGNICRSPSAEGVFRQIADRHGLTGKLLIDSCSTGPWHVGKTPDPRAIEATARRGVDISRMRARQLRAQDLDEFHHVLVMDRQNLADVLDVWRQNGGTKPELLMSYSKTGYDEVPDPYYGGEDGFEQMLDLIEDANEGLAKVLRGQLA